MKEVVSEIRGLPLVSATNKREYVVVMNDKLGVVTWDTGVGLYKILSADHPVCLIDRVSILMEQACRSLCTLLQYCVSQGYQVYVFDTTIQMFQWIQARKTGQTLPAAIEVVDEMEYIYVKDVKPEDSMEYGLLSPYHVGIVVRHALDLFAVSTGKQGEAKNLAHSNLLVSSWKTDSLSAFLGRCLALKFQVFAFDTTSELLTWAVEKGTALANTK